MFYLYCERWGFIVNISKIKVFFFLKEFNKKGNKFCYIYKNLYNVDS